MASGISTFDRQRRRVRVLLDEQSPADALAGYYALHCPAERAQLHVHPDGDGPADGFLVVARTGIDLFRPLVTFRAASEAVTLALFGRGLTPGRPLYLTVPERLAVWANQRLAVADAELHRIYRLDVRRFEPVINVLVVTSHDPGGGPRCEIRAGGEVGAVAGVNWQSPGFAEIYVYTEPAVRGRGWGKAVVSSLISLILKSGRTPLYVVSESNDYSIRLAEAVGFADTGQREYVGHAVWAGPPRG